MAEQGVERPFVLGHADYIEVLSRVRALRRIALELVDVFDQFGGRDQEAATGARAMVASTERILEVLHAAPDEDDRSRAP